MIKHINFTDFINYSGGAVGSDRYWEITGKKYRFLNHNHFWYKFKNPYSSDDDEITEEQYQEGIIYVKKANLTLKRKNIERYLHLLSRNWQQVKNADTIFAIGEFNTKTTLKGGTGWAVQMAIDIINQFLYLTRNQKNGIFTIIINLNIVIYLF